MGIPPRSWCPTHCLAPGAPRGTCLNYHHLDGDIGKVIMPGPTTGREYEIFGSIVMMVTDYQEMNASALSTACGVSVTIAPLDPIRVGHRVEQLGGEKDYQTGSRQRREGSVGKRDR